MININNQYFHLQTKNVSYIIHVDETKHIVLDYFGNKIPVQKDYNAIVEKWPFAFGTETVYNDELSKSKSLDLLSLEYSSIGKGDYNEPSIILKDKKGYVFDFVFEKYKVNKKVEVLKTLPTPHSLKEELVIYLKEISRKIILELHYILDIENDVILRNTVLINNENYDVTLNKLSSMQLNLVNDNFELINLYGGWISEGNKEIIPLKHGIYVNDSKTGCSSNRHNPFFVLKEKNSTLNSGKVFAFNLIYSGNHQEMVELTNYEKVRIQSGISPYCFEYDLHSKDRFETSVSFLTFSDIGVNGTALNMHHFINDHVIKGYWAKRARPVIINNWEATQQKFDETKLLEIAKKGKDAGCEMFVLDDGWFSTRNNDTSGLGDYDVNKKKLPHDLKGLAEKINKLDMKFGLWFEPEMVNPDSKLFRAHPEYAITQPYVKYSLGRNQLTLNLTNVDVQNYIIENVNKILASANIEYVKWDMNRNISDMNIEGRNKGEFYHEYIKGLYRIMNEITKANPKVLFENCASGGNRHDLGMLSYFQQSWTSDDTDAYERINIQSGIALGYPLSTLKCHVSTSPSQQALRNIPIETRFNVACFGVLGFEMELSHLNDQHYKIIKEDIEFYKQHRDLIQFGDFYQLDFIENENHATWMVISKDKKDAIIGYFNGLQSTHAKTTELKACAFNPNWQYEFDVKPQKLNLHMFGSLVNMISPVHLNENGGLFDLISKVYQMDGEKESYIVSGAILNNGAIKLTQQWTGCGYSDEVRVLGDFGSRLYIVRKAENLK